MAKRKKSAKHCEFIKADGERCRGWRGKGSRFCIAHDPERRNIAQAARRKAARVTAAKSSPVDYQIAEPMDVGDPPTTVEELRDFVGKLIHWTAAGKLEPRRASALLQMAKQAERILPAGKPKPKTTAEQLTDEQMLEQLLAQVELIKMRVEANRNDARAGGNGRPEVAK